MPSALFARPRFFNDCSEKDTVRLLMSRPVARICSAISAAERAPRRPRTSAIAEPMVWRASAWLLASGLRLVWLWPRRRSCLPRGKLVERLDLALGDAKIGDLRLQLNDLGADTFE